MLLVVTLSFVCLEFLYIVYFVDAYWILNDTFPDYGDENADTESNDQIATDYIEHVHAEKNDVNASCSVEASICKDGIILPIWYPQDGLTGNVRTFRAALYMLGMLYMFLGVAIVSDRFVTAIEVITSQEKEAVVNMPGGKTEIVRVRIWNDTVANLTLMALGSSAPEIMLSIIEIFGNNFSAGDLGPSTIVGSAAYNLFIITAISVYVVPSHETRKIKQLSVFFVTATWSIFAYIWLYIILLVTSEGVIEIWEAVLTFLFFPGTVLTAYMADRQICMSQIEITDDLAKKTEGQPDVSASEHKNIHRGMSAEEVLIKTLEQKRDNITEVVRELQEKYPYMDMQTLVYMARNQYEVSGPKSRAYYRRMKKKKRSIINIKTRFATPSDTPHDSQTTRIFFSSDNYMVIESAGTFRANVIREGGNMSMTCHVDYTTENGTAKAGKDYLETKGTLIFEPFEDLRHIHVPIIDDETYEDKEHFYVKLLSAKLVDQEGNIITDTNNVAIASPSRAAVEIIDDDHPGVFYFPSDSITVPEDIGDMGIKVCRSTGGRGRIGIPYKVMDETAISGISYEVLGRDIIFEHQEFEKDIKVRIFNKKNYKRNETFVVIIGRPRLLDKETSHAVDSDIIFRFEASTTNISDVSAKNAAHSYISGVSSGSKSNTISGIDTSASQLTTVTEPKRKAIRPQLGEFSKLTVTITESTEFREAVDELMASRRSIQVTPMKWSEQFTEAMKIGQGQEESDLYPPSLSDYALHYLTLIWKIAVACVPPTRYWDGWAAFSMSIFLIGIMTTIIGDLASSFGCTVGLKDSLTAITLVAVGTSLPDTFASKLAAINEKYADSAIGNVTGSNAVNVFMGLGIAWTFAAIYHSIHEDTFEVPPGDLTLSVIVFCILSFLAVIVVLARRHPMVGGELGGPLGLKILTTVVLFKFWCIYLVISTLVIYCVISPL